MKTSNRILFTALAVLIVLITVAAIKFKLQTNDNYVKGDGKFITYKQSFEPFHKLIIERGLKVEYGIGNSNALTIEADSNLLQNVVAKVEDNTLRIKYVRNRGKSLKCILTAPMVREIKLSAGARLNSKDTLEAQNLELTVNAGSTLNLMGNIDTIASSVNAGSKATLIGSCKELEVSVNAGSKVYAFGLITDHLIVDANAGSYALVNGKEIEASASSGSTIKYKEGAILKRINTSSGGSINSKKGD